MPFTVVSSGSPPASWRKQRKCKFYWNDGGLCRRYPPQVVISVWSSTISRDHPDGGDVESTRNYLFPEMVEDDWCGEFEEKEK